MWPYTSEELDWLSSPGGASRASDRYSSGDGPGAVSLVISPELIDQYVARGRRLRAEALSAMLGRLFGALFGSLRAGGAIESPEKRARPGRRRGMRQSAAG